MAGRERFTPKDETVLLLTIFPFLHMPTDSPDAEYLLKTTATLMNKQPYPNRADSFAKSFLRRITGSDLPQPRIPLESGSIILRVPHIPYHNVTYVTPYARESMAYIDPLRPRGNALILEVLTQEGNPDRNGRRSAQKIRYILTHRVIENGETKDYSVVKGKDLDQHIYPTRVQRFILMGTEGVAQATEISQHLLSE